MSLLLPLALVLSETVSSPVLGQDSRLVDVEGRQVRVRTAGLGRADVAGPVVVFEAGFMYDGLRAGSSVLGDVATFAPVIAYNRAGIGESEPDGLPPTPRHVAGNLRRLLTALGADPPYVLVGHSLGGPFIRMFTELFPDEVAGLVYIDPTPTTSEAEGRERERAMGLSEASRPLIEAVQRERLAAMPSASVRAEAEMMIAARAAHWPDFQDLAPLPDVPVAILMAGRYDPRPDDGLDRDCEPERCHAQVLKVTRDWYARPDLGGQGGVAHRCHGCGSLHPERRSGARRLDDPTDLVERAGPTRTSAGGAKVRGSVRVPPTMAFVLLFWLGGCATVPERIVAVGDVHGDIQATREALRLAGAIDDEDRWVGGELVVVQTGDQLDRGDDEQAILDLFDRLRVEARASGGAFHALLGNHELMNAGGDLRYVTEGGFRDFQDAVEWDPDDPDFAALEPHQRARMAALRPGGPYALMLAERDVILQGDGNVFVHGGVLPQHVAYGIDAINEQTRAWLRGEAGFPAMLDSSESPVWTRLYSSNPDEQACEVLRQVLESLDAERMVMSHTVQEDGIRSVCDGRAWLIDVGLARYYGGAMEVLEIRGDSVGVLKGEGAPEG